MRRDPLVVIAGMARGGTNLLWNIVQSHSRIIDSYYELNEICGHKTGISLCDKLRIEVDALLTLNVGGSKIVRERLKRFTKHSFDNDPFNCFKAPNETYNMDDFHQLLPCTKLVSAWEVDKSRTILRRNDALKYLPILDQAFECKRIFLVRNGLARAEGWGRRGCPVDVAAKWYRKYVHFYEKQVELNPSKNMLVRYDDLLLSPFEAASRIYAFLGLSEQDLDYLRIAIKPTINSNQNVKNTTQKEKVWVGRDNFQKYLDFSIDNSQIRRLSESDKMRFLDVNEDLMARYFSLNAENDAEERAFT